MFARIMGIVSPSIFLSASIVWGFQPGILSRWFFLSRWVLRRRSCRFVRGVGQLAASLSA